MDSHQSHTSHADVVTVYLRLYNMDGGEIAVLTKEDGALVAPPRIGEDYVTAARYGVPVIAVEHDTVSAEHHVSLFLDERVGDADPVIAVHIDDGWTLVRDERGSAHAAQG